MIVEFFHSKYWLNIILIKRIIKFVRFRSVIYIFGQLIILDNDVTGCLLLVSNTL